MEHVGSNLRPQSPRPLCDILCVVLFVLRYLVHWTIGAITEGILVAFINGSDYLRRWVSDLFVFKTKRALGKQNSAVDDKRFVPLFLCNFQSRNPGDCDFELLELLDLDVFDDPDHRRERFSFHLWFLDFSRLRVFSNIFATPDDNLLRRNSTPFISTTPVSA